jgi:uncharacterized lipoprotein YajG
MKLIHDFSKFTIAMALVATTLLGCSSTPEEPITIKPLLAKPQLLMSVGSLDVIDKRKQKALALINKEPQMPVDDLAVMVSPWLKQAILTNTTGRNKLSFEITDATAYVTQYSMSFKSESVVAWQVTISSPKKTWSKSYQTGINQDGPLQMSQQDIAKNFNVMLMTLLDRTLRDPEFQTALSNRY